jgi:predicted permease
VVLVAIVAIIVTARNIVVPLVAWGIVALAGMSATSTREAVLTLAIPNRVDLRDSRGPVQAR